MKRNRKDTGAEKNRGICYRKDRQKARTDSEEGAREKQAVIEADLQRSHTAVK